MHAHPSWRLVVPKVPMASVVATMKQPRPSTVPTGGAGGGGDASGCRAHRPYRSSELGGRDFFACPVFGVPMTTPVSKLGPFFFSELAFDVMKTNARHISHLFSSFSFIPGAGAQSRPRCRGYWTVTCSTTLNSVQPRRSLFHSARGRPFCESRSAGLL